ncbi:MAG: hypothetical protein WBB73_06270 [Candidatus Aminicenantaceae bacterium]
MTKRHFIGILVTLVMIITLCSMVMAKDPPYKSVWNTAQMSVDGTEFDWMDATPFFEKKVAADIAFKNDANFLYVLFKFKDPKQFMSTISWTGMTVYLDASGKKTKDYFINFRKKQITAEEFILNLEAERGALSQADKDKIRVNEFYVDHDVEVSNKKAKSQSLDGVERIVPAIFRANQSQDETYLWEIAIPLARPADMAPGIGAAPGQQIKVGFQWGGPTDEWKEAQAARMGAQNTQASNRARGGLSSESGGASANLDSNIGLASMRRQMPKKYDVWVDVVLANQQ